MTHLIALARCPHLQILQRSITFLRRLMYRLSVRIEKLVFPVRLSNLGCWIVVFRCEVIPFKWLQKDIGHALSYLIPDVAVCFSATFPITFFGVLIQILKRGFCDESWGYKIYIFTMDYQNRYDTSYFLYPIWKLTVI